MREFRVPGRTVPVFFARRNNNNIPYDNQLVLRLCGNHPFSRSDHEDLFAVVGMKLVSNAFPEIHDIDLELFAVRQKRLVRPEPVKSGCLNGSFLTSLILTTLISLSTTHRRMTELARTGQTRILAPALSSSSFIPWRKSSSAIWKLPGPEALAAAFSPAKPK